MNMKKSLIAAIALTGSLSVGAQPAGFEPVKFNKEFGVAFRCAQAYGGVTPAAAGCTALALTVDEIDKCFTDGIGGKGCFGENNTLVKTFRDNIVAARRENTPPEQVIRAATGVSMKDIRDKGILGGDNSEARKECRRLPKWGFHCS